MYLFIVEFYKKIFKWRLGGKIKHADVAGYLQGWVKTTSEDILL